MTEDKDKSKALRADGKLFKKRVAALGFKQTEMAILLKKSVRLVNFYVHAKRHVPPEVWLRLKVVEGLEREHLWRLIVKGRKLALKLKLKKQQRK